MEITFHGKRALVTGATKGMITKYINIFLVNTGF